METRIDVRQHRRYDFLHEFDIDWCKLDAGDEEEVEKYDSLDSDRYCFTLDFFEHSAIAFSLVIDRRDIWYYEFDRSRNVWIIGVKKQDGLTCTEAAEIARDRLEEYNNYLNGRDEEEY